MSEQPPSPETATFEDVAPPAAAAAASPPPASAAASAATPPPAPGAASSVTAPPADAAAGQAPPAPAGPSRGELLLEKGAHLAGRGLRASVRELSERRGLRTVLLGLLLTLLALRLGGDSALSVPLLVFGVVMLIVGAMGPRLRGHIGLDFGPEGTAITMHTHVAPPGRRLAADPDGASVIQLPPRPRIALVPTAPPAPVSRQSGAQSAPDRRTAAATATPPATPAAAAGAEPRDADVVESTGETVEIDVAQLRALLAAERARDAS